LDTGEIRFCGVSGLDTNLNPLAMQNGWGYRSYVPVSRASPRVCPVTAVSTSW
jgi:hypothetical protein